MIYERGNSKKKHALTQNISLIIFPLAGVEAEDNKIIEYKIEIVASKYIERVEFV